MSARDDRAGDLFDLLAASPNGVTVDDIKAALECDHPTANQTIRDLRLTLGDTDEVFVTCHPQGQGERWLYRLAAGTRVIDPDTPEGRWIENRIRDTKARLQTMHASMRVAARSTDGRTALGREARVLETGLRHMQESLALLDGQPH